MWTPGGDAGLVGKRRLAHRCGRRPRGRGQWPLTHWRSVVRNFGAGPRPGVPDSWRLTFKFPMVPQHNTRLWLFSNQVQSLEWEGRSGGRSPLSARTSCRLQRSWTRLTLVHCFFLAKHSGPTSTPSVKKVHAIKFEFAKKKKRNNNSNLNNPSSSRFFLSSLHCRLLTVTCSDPPCTLSSAKVQTPPCSPPRSRLLTEPQSLSSSVCPRRLPLLPLTCEGVRGTEFSSVIGSAVIPVPSHSCLGQDHWLRLNSPPTHSGRQKRKLYSFFDRLKRLLSSLLHSSESTSPSWRTSLRSSSSNVKHLRHMQLLKDQPAERISINTIWHYLEFSCRWKIVLSRLKAAADCMGCCHPAGGELGWEWDNLRTDWGREMDSIRTRSFVNSLEIDSLFKKKINNSIWLTIPLNRYQFLHTAPILSYRET